MYQISFIIFTTFILVGFSWRSLRHPRSHGFFRFFAWEAILVQITINLLDWFANPFSWNQLISWILLSISIYPAFCGFYLLYKSGGPRLEREEHTNYLFEDTTVLVTHGIYKYIRHPLYSSLLFLTWGAFFKNLSWVGIGVSLTASIFIFITAVVEEQENLVTFGLHYTDYRKKTKMFIPFFF
jgi:protein-S-isoprenylcysteine O-methyltransferase Ste14